MRGRSTADGGELRGAERLPAISAWFRERRAASIAIGTLLELGVALLSHRISSVRFVGVPGALGVLIAITVALVSGTVCGGATALIGALLFVTIVTGLDDRADLLRGMPVVLVWTLAALIAGGTAERQRRRTAQALDAMRSAKAEAEALSAAFEQILESTPVFHAKGQREDVAAAMCSTALETFACDDAALWSVVGSELRLLARRPALEGELSSRPVPLAEVPAIRDDVVARGHVAFVPDVEREAVPLAWRARAARLGLRASLRVPISVAGEVAHLLELGWSAPVPPPTREALVVAQRFADQASLALEQARVRVAEDEVAELHRRLETGLLPTLDVLDAGVDIATRYQAGEDRLLLGGDFYDAVELRDGAIAVLVGDVSGHGPAAAATGATVRAAWRGLVLAGSDANTLLTTLQAVLERDRLTPETFVTCCCIWLWSDRQGCTVALAGHPPPLLVNGRPRALAAAPGPPLGAMPEARWPATDLELPPDWELLLFTDGLIEGRAAPGSPRRLGQDGLIALLEQIQADGDRMLVGGLNRLLAEVKAANGDRFDDDVAVVYAAAVPPLRQA